MIGGICKYDYLFPNNGRTFKHCAYSPTNNELSVDRVSEIQLAQKRCDQK